MELAAIQRDILSALMSLYKKKGRAIKGEEIAEALDRSPGTIRNQMQSLRALELVEGVPGPKGGYKATHQAFQVLGFDKIEQEVQVPVLRNSVEVKGLTVVEIEFTTIRHPDICQAIFKIIGDIKIFNVGDIIQIGPTAVNMLVIRGEVTGRDDINGMVLCDIMEMVSLPKMPLGNFLKEPYLGIPVNKTIIEAARILIANKLRDAGIEKDGEVVGIVSFDDIGKAIAKIGPDARVEQAMMPKVITIDYTKTLNDALVIMNREDTGRLIVVKDGSNYSIITKIHVFNNLASFMYHLSS